MKGIRGIATAAVFILLLVPLQMPGQEQGQGQEQDPLRDGKPDEVIRVRVDRVSVVFSVTNRRGRYVTGLGPDDFTVLEDGKNQDIDTRNFSSETNLPLRIGLLIDTSSSIRSRFQFEQEAAIDFLHTVLRPKTDQAFVISFDAEPELVQDLTGDPIDLAEAIRELRPGGGTTLYEAIYLASKMKMAESTDEQGRPFRKLLIVLSDGNDTGSLVTREEALEMAQRHDVTIFTVSTSAMPIQYSGKSMELQNPCKVMGQDGDKVLKRYAKATGGTAYCPFNTIDVGRSFERIANELRSQYTITYNPTNKERVRRFREIRISTRRKGLEVHHRPGYYSRAEEDEKASDNR